MKLNNTQLINFVGRIKLKRDNMPKYKEQINNLIENLQKKIDSDEKTDLRVTKFLIAGSWAKRTILRHTGDHPIDIDLILYIEGDENLKNDIEKLHDYVVQYLKDIYPSKEDSDIEADGKTKSIKIKFIGTGMEVDIVPVVSINTPIDYVWQPQRGGGGRYITSVTKQLEFASDRKKNNTSYTAIVRSLKWWKNYQELKDEELSSFAIELIVSYLDINEGVETNIEKGILRFFTFVSNSSFPIISFKEAINTVPAYSTPIYICDPTNKENNAAKKMEKKNFDEIKKKANDAFEGISIAQSKSTDYETIEEWKSIFGSSFNINTEE